MNEVNIEKRRRILQTKLDNEKNQLERNKLGQFSTPFELACDILNLSKKYQGICSELKFLDPAIGTGVFYSALLATHSMCQIKKAKGFEIDNHYGEPSLELWNEQNLDYEISDFTINNAFENDKYNLIICNPPYVRHHHIKERKKELQQKAYEVAGIKLSGLSGLYCYFMALAHPWMEKKGLAIWLVPSEFMDVNYGNAIKDYLLKKVELISIHRFEPRDLQFGDAMVTSAVVVFRNQLPSKDHEVEFTYGGSLTEPKIKKVVSLDDLSVENKWTRFPMSAVRLQNELPTLGDFFTVKRGIATGDNKFFILTLEAINQLNLPLSQFRPILPSPRYLNTSKIEADKDGHPIISNPLFVIDCEMSLVEVEHTYPSLYNYLKKGIENGVPDRYLCKKRKSWFAQEKREESLFYCTYIGRANKNRSSPFRFILNKSKAIVSNSYLILYPKPELKRALEENPDLRVLILESLNAISSKSMTDEGRIYGGGMQKLEPKELLKVPAPEIASIIEDN